MRNPHNKAEWQDAVDAAEACLLLESARLYGLVEGGPAVDVKRCEEILRRGRQLGVAPAADCVERFLKEL